MRACIHACSPSPEKIYIIIYSLYYGVLLAVSLAVSLIARKRPRTGRLAVPLAVSLAVSLAVPFAVSLMKPQTNAEPVGRKRQRVNCANERGARRPRTAACGLRRRPRTAACSPRKARVGMCAAVAGGYGLRAPSGWAHGGGGGGLDATARRGGGG